MRAQKNGLEFNIEPVDITMPTHCPVLGLELNRLAPMGSHNLPSLDRIDPDKGYIKGNIWVISWRANRLKSDASLEELKAVVQAIEERLSCTI